MQWAIMSPPAIQAGWAKLKVYNCLEGDFLVYLFARQNQTIPIKEQWFRILRWFKRLEQIRDNPDKYSIADYSDFFITFFQNCHMMRDWLIKSNIDGLLKDEINTLFNSRTLKICRDISNSYKHLSLDEKKQPLDKDFFTFSEYDPEFGMKFQDNESSEIYVLVKGKRYEIFELATDCLEILSDFFSKHNILDLANELTKPKIS